MWHYVIYYESMKRKILKPIHECRCNGRLQTKRFTRLVHTGSVVELEHLKIKTRLTNEKDECEGWVWDLDTIDAPSRLRFTRKDATLVRGRPTLLLSCVRKSNFFFYHESMKRKLKIKPTYECLCNGRLQTKRFIRLTHTGLVVELEHLKIKTRLTNEKLLSVKGEWDW